MMDDPRSCEDDGVIGEADSSRPQNPGGRTKRTVQKRNDAIGEPELDSLPKPLGSRGTDGSKNETTPSVSRNLTRSRNPWGRTERTVQKRNDAIGEPELDSLPKPLGSRGTDDSKTKRRCQ